MFDDLRSKNDDQSSFFQDDLADIDPLLDKKSKESGLGNLGLNFRFNSKTFLGMNAFQRFVISMMLLIVVCIMGTMLLMITGSIELF